VVGAALDVVVVGAALDVVVVGAALDVVVVGAALDVVVVGAPLDVVVVSAPLLVVVVGASLDVVVVGAPLDVVVVVSSVVLVVVSSVVLVVVSGGPVVVVVPPEIHVPSAAHASQQLDCDPTHAVPPCGGLQSSSRCLILHIVWPCSSVRQQVTKPGLPQVDRAAQRTTASLHSCRSDPSFTAASARCATQLTYVP